MQNIAYKFAKWDVPELDAIKENVWYKLRIKVMNGIKLTRQEKNDLYKELQSNLYSKTGIPRHGWLFPFKEVLHKYFIEYNDSHVRVVYAPDKTSIRSFEYGISKITEGM
jgi:hypothetical protein